ncbi:MAG: UDP-N-acetylglucosamine 1-carboxyvinyltransferase [Patescibacteria group bacterium]|nr:UDP-N-acetylglucosamine 1-carboxyvinyltransferase [Patescibacteria group bacterium]
MEKFIIQGGKKLRGTISVSGAKNVALKAIVAACLTDEEIVIENIPLISDLIVMTEILKELGGKIKIKNHTATINVKNIKTSKISLEEAAYVRTSSMFIVPLLIRTGHALVPNPGGCRIGARPIDRVIKGLKLMGVNINYDHKDGFFHAKVKGGLKAINYKFEKNTHTGTETLILAASVARGKSVLENAAQEPEIDELIDLINKMGGNIKRIKPRMIVIQGVKKLHGTKFRISPDRNEVVTLAIASILTGGDIFIKEIKRQGLSEFLDLLKAAGGEFEEKIDGIRFFSTGKALRATNIETTFYPGFMTDWQGPWAVLMTKAKGVSTIHETVYENRFGYVEELKKMGAKIRLYNPKIKNPQEVYNFNLNDDKKGYRHAAKIYGPVNLHNAVVNISDLRAGATLVLAALVAKGQSVVFGIEHLDRGYEKFEQRLKKVGANIERTNHE